MTTFMKWLVVIAGCFAIGAAWDGEWSVGTYFMAVAIFGQQLIAADER